MKTDPLPKRPFEEVSADLFSLAGKTFLVFVDRLSGFPLIAEWRNDPSSQQVAYECREFFSLVGVPTKFRSDQGPQFAAASFKKFLQRWGVEWIPSSPHFPSSNGLAESHVRTLKNMIAKLENPDIKSEEFQEAILELRNTPRADGRSPNQIVFGRNLRSTLPVHYSSFDEKWKLNAKAADEKHISIHEKAHQHYDRSSRDLRPLRVGTKVRVQDHSTKKWQHVGIIVGIGENRDYRIKLPSGRTWWRNRKFLREFHDDLEAGGDDRDEKEPSDANIDENSEKEDTASKKEDETRSAIRRSSRKKKATVRFGINCIKTYDLSIAEQRYKRNAY